MSKITFSKLKLAKKEEIKSITINDIDIEVKQYLPINEKINIITSVLQNSADENNFANPMKVEVFLNLEMVYAYTNLTFTDKQKEDPTKLYDLLEENNVFAKVISAIPETEYKLLLSWTEETIDAFYKYKNSAMGIFEQISADYSGLDFDATQLQEKMADPESLGLLKNIMTNLG